MKEWGNNAKDINAYILRKAEIKLELLRRQRMAKQNVSAEDKGVFVDLNNKRKGYINIYLHKNFRHEVQNGGIRNKFWIPNSKGEREYLFKKNTDDYTDFVEVLYSYLCKEINQPCTNVHFAKCYKPIREGENIVSKGVVSQNYTKGEQNILEVLRGENLVNLDVCGNSVESLFLGLRHLVALDSENRNIPTYLSENLHTDLTKRVIVDYLFHNIDADLKNIDFLIRKNHDGTREIDLAKCYDNALGFGFCVGDTKEFVEENIKELKECEDLVEKGEYDKALFNMNETLGIPLMGISMDPDSVVNSPNVNYGIILNDIALGIARNPELLDFYKGIQLNVRKTVEQIEGEHKGIKYPQEVVDLADSVYSVKKQCLDRELEIILDNQYANFTEDNMF